MRKGQLMGQPFVYIFLLIVAAIILFFGIKALIGMLDLGKDVEFNKFANEIQNKADSVYSDSFGSMISLEDINVPSSISEVCIIDRANPIDLSLVSGNELRDFIEISYNGYQPENVFFASDELRSMELENVGIVGNNPLCDRTIDGRIDIRLVNHGDIVLAEPI